MRADDRTSAYRPAEQAWLDFGADIASLVARDDVRRVCDVGGGAKPLLDPDEVRRHGLDYVVLDISRDELDKADDSYTKVCADVGGDDLLGQLAGVRGDGFDLVFSKTLVEHIADPVALHRNVRAMLRPGGVAVHFFPTLYAPPFVANRVLPASVSAWILLRVQSRRTSDGLEGKFKAYYRWCRGPSVRQRRRYEQSGFDVEEYRGYFGAQGYYRPLGLGGLDAAATRLLLRRPVAALTTYAIVRLRAAA